MANSPHLLVDRRRSLTASSVSSVRMFSATPVTASTRAIADHEGHLLGLPRLRLPHPHFLRLAEDDGLTGEAKRFADGNSSDDSDTSDDDEDNNRRKKRKSGADDDDSSPLAFGMMVESATQTGGDSDAGAFLVDGYVAGSSGRSGFVDRGTFLQQQREATAWQERVWELQQITYLMDTLVPTKEFYRTRAGIGDSAKEGSSIRYYAKPNTAPPSRLRSLGLRGGGG